MVLSFLPYHAHRPTDTCGSLPWLPALGLAFFSLLPGIFLLSVRPTTACVFLRPPLILFYANGARLRRGQHILWRSRGSSFSTASAAAEGSTDLSCPVYLQDDTSSEAPVCPYEASLPGFSPDCVTSRPVERLPSNPYQLHASKSLICVLHASSTLFPDPGQQPAFPHHSLEQG